MTVMVMWSLPNVTSGRTLSWSFVVAAVVVVMDLASCGLFIMDFLSQRVRPVILSRAPAISIPQGVRTLRNGMEEAEEAIELHSLNSEPES